MLLQTILIERLKTFKILSGIIGKNTPLKFLRIMFKITLFGLSSVFYTSCTKKEPYLFIGKTHKFKNLLNLMTLDFKHLCFLVNNPLNTHRVFNPIIFEANFQSTLSNCGSPILIHFDFLLS